jgi:hypothetical protein
VRKVTPEMTTWVGLEGGVRGGWMCWGGEGLGEKGLGDAGVGVGILVRLVFGGLAWLGVACLGGASSHTRPQNWARSYWSSAFVVSKPDSVNIELIR